MPKDASSINLVKRRVSFVDKFITWTLSIGRAVVILTEIIALSAFLYRFSLDRQLIDIHSKIKQEQTIVNYSKSSEDKYRNLQDRLTLISSLSTAASQKVNIIKDIVSFTPSGISFNTFTVYEDRVKIDATFNQASLLGTFVDSLKKYPLIESVSIDKIENKPSTSQIIVSILGTFKQKGGKNANSK